MKINNRSFTKAHEDVVVFPREGGDVVFKIKAILDFKPFEALCPQPKPPLIQFPGEDQAKANVEDPGYIAALHKWAQNKSNWVFLNTVRETDGLEWDNVNYADSSTWDNWEKDLQAAFFNDQEIAYLAQKAFGINNLNQQNLDDARKRFLAVQAKQVQSI